MSQSVLVYDNDKMVEFKPLRKVIEKSKENIICIKQWEDSLKLFLKPIILNTSENPLGIQNVLYKSKIENITILEEVKKDENNILYYKFDENWLQKASIHSIMSIITLLTIYNYE